MSLTREGLEAIFLCKRYWLQRWLISDRNAVAADCMEQLFDDVMAWALAQPEPGVEVPVSIETTGDRLRAWYQRNPRPPADLAFAAGALRTAARIIEDLARERDLLAIRLTRAQLDHAMCAEQIAALRTRVNALEST